MRNKLPALSLLPLAMTTTALAQIAPNNNYAQMLMNTNSMMQLSLSQTIAAQAQTNARAGTSGGTPAGWCDPLPPFDLQRGADGHVPPELQSDPRYQQWLRCRQGQGQGQGAAQTRSAAVPPPRGAPAAGWPSAPSYAPASAEASESSYPTPESARHTPMAATDFVPAVNGHPAVEQILRSMPLTAEQRTALARAFMQMSGRIATAARPNNLAAAMSADICLAILTVDHRFTDADSNRYLAAINDRLSSSPQFAAMSGAQKQTLADSLIFQTTMIEVLSELGQSDPQAKLQSIQLAHTVLQQLTGSPSGRLNF